MASGRAAAFFDVDGTLTRSDIARDHVSFRRAVRSGPALSAWMLGWPLRGLLLLAVDRVSRTAVNRLTYAWYRDFERAELERWAERFQDGPGLERLFPRGRDLLARHAEAGTRLVFVTGALTLLVEPLARCLSLELPGKPDIRVEGVDLEERDGRFTGAIVGEPLGGEEKARRVLEVAEEEDLDLSRSHAYGDSIADLPLLDAVGRPAAVNPDRRLRRTARRRGWPVLELSSPPRPAPTERAPLPAPARTDGST